MDVDGMMIILDEIDEYIHVSDDINRIIMTIIGLLDVELSDKTRIKW